MCIFPGKWDRLLEESARVQQIRKAHELRDDLPNPG